jgi:hypothetical protein
LSLPNSCLGVGKLEIKNAEILQCLRNTSPWESLGLAYREKTREREVDVCYLNLGGVFLTLYGPKWVVPPCFCHKLAKNQQIKLAGKDAEMTKHLHKISVSEN